MHFVFCAHDLLSPFSYLYPLFQNLNPAWPWKELKLTSSSKYVAKVILTLSVRKLERYQMGDRIIKILKTLNESLLLIDKILNRCCNRKSPLLHVVLNHRVLTIDTRAQSNHILVFCGNHHKVLNHRHLKELLDDYNQSLTTFNWNKKLIRFLNYQIIKKKYHQIKLGEAEKNYCPNIEV